jgi:AdoMet-dependent rRNA methyltransferase SPB1
MDIGLERQDGFAGDEPDFVFDLNEVEGHGGRTQKVQLQTNEADESDVEDSGDEDGEDDGGDGEESDDDKYGDLEKNLDEMYNEYQNARLAKDAKHKVKEDRKKRDALAGTDGEWGGIKSRGKEDAESEASGDEEDDDHDDSQAYVNYDPDALPSDELDSSDEEEDAAATAPSKKRGRDGNLIQDFKAPKKPLDTSTAKSRAAAMWFDQPIFKNVDGLEDLMKVGDAPVSSKEKKGVTFEAEDGEQAVRSSLTRRKMRFVPLLLTASKLAGTDHAIFKAEEGQACAVQPSALG